MKDKKALGKGMDALFPEAAKEVVTEKLENDKLKVISNEVVTAAARESQENPRVVSWSPTSSAVLRYLRKTVPEFSISNEASHLLEEGVKKKYPEIWEKVKAHMKSMK
jgi:hypothetical protein